MIFSFHFFQYPFCNILIVPEVEVIVPGPMAAVSEDDGRYSVVALAHHEV